MPTYRQTAGTPLTFEQLGLDYGFVLYRAATPAGTLDFPVVHDRAYVYVNKERYGLVSRNHKVKVMVPAGTLDVLVENLGRANTGKLCVQPKGLVKGATIDEEDIINWQHFGFNLTGIGSLTWEKEVPWGQLGFFRTRFQVDIPEDTFLNPAGWQKGVAFVNGFNVGRYWAIGPQQKLYVPGPILKVGDNELVVFDVETTGAAPKTMSFDNTHQVSHINGPGFASV